MPFSFVVYVCGIFLCLDCGKNAPFSLPPLPPPPASLAFVAYCYMHASALKLESTVKCFKVTVRFDHLQVVLTDKPPVMSRPMTIFYKHHIGAYKHAGNLFKELIKLMPSDAITVGIYYDDPEVSADVESEHTSSSSHIARRFSRRVRPSLLRKVKQSQTTPKVFRSAPGSIILPKQQYEYHFIFHGISIRDFSRYMEFKELILLYHSIID